MNYLTLAIVDGWVLKESVHSPLWRQYRRTALPTGFESDEVGYRTITAGRRVPSSRAIITSAISSGQFFTNATLLAAAQRPSAMHIVDCDEVLTASLKKNAARVKAKRVMVHKSDENFVLSHGESVVIACADISQSRQLAEGFRKSSIRVVELVDIFPGEPLRNDLFQVLERAGRANAFTLKRFSPVQLHDFEKQNGTMIVMGFHATQPVPFIVVSDATKRDLYHNAVQIEQDILSLVARPQGSFIDIAPTVLDLLGVTQPAGMTGQSLLDRLQ